MEPAIASPFGPKTWVTGTPRTDLLVMGPDALPADLRRRQDDLEALVGDRSLVVWAPAVRAPGRSASVPGGDDLAWLADWARRHHAVLGLRLAVPDDDAQSAWQEAGFLDLSAQAFPDVEPVLRVAAALVSDYTPELADFLVLDRPVVAWVPDLDEVTAYPGLLHDLEEVVPGGLCRDESALRERLESLFDDLTSEQAAEHARKRDRMHAYCDGRCAARVVRRVKETYLPIAEWLAEP